MITMMSAHEGVGDEKVHCFMGKNSTWKCSKTLCRDLLQKAQRLGTLPSLCQPGRMPREGSGLDSRAEFHGPFSFILTRIMIYVLFRSPVAFQSMRQARCI